MALSIFVHQYLFYRKGLEFAIAFTCLLVINFTFYTVTKSVASRMDHEGVVENNIHNIMSVDESAANSFDNWIRTTDKTPPHGNYTYEMVIDEINSIYRREKEF